MKYPWKVLMQKKTFTILHSEYDCARSSMPQQIRNAAVRLGKYVKIADGEDGFKVRVSDTPFLKGKANAES